jgi:hypothetical protein
VGVGAVRAFELEHLDSQKPFYRYSPMNHLLIHLIREIHVHRHPYKFFISLGVDFVSWL